MSSPSVGRNLRRSEDHEFLTGAATYVADVRDPLLDGAGHVAFVRSIHAHARLVEIDTSEAVTAPGVRAVVTSEDLPVVPPGPFAPAIHPIFVQPLLAEGKVRLVGQPIAAVVADTAASAADAAELVRVDYDPLPVVLDLDDALTNSTILFEPADQARMQATAAESEPHTRGNIAADSATDNGPTVAAFAEHDAPRFLSCDVVLRQRMHNPRQSPAPMEPRAVACAWDAAGHLHVWSATQRPHGCRDSLAALYAIDPQRITVTAGPRVGGGFGGKVSRTVEENILPYLAELTGAPVRWHETRSEYLLTSTQGRGEQFDLMLAGSNDGRIAALRVDMVKDGGAYPITGVLLPVGYTIPNAAGPYDIPHVEAHVRSVATNRPATSAFRGAGRAPMISALERMIDLYADEIGMDPADVRRRNLVQPADMPYRSATNALYDEADYPGDLERVLHLVEYTDRRAEQAERRASGADRQIGIGIAAYNHMTVGGGGEEARVTVEADGSALVVTGSTSQGHGHGTTWAQIAADVLGIPIDRIRVEEGSTELTATGVGAVGSRSLQTAGVAIHKASTTLVDRARRVAADLLEAAVDDVVLDVEKGAFHIVGTPAIVRGWDEIAAAAWVDDSPHEELSCGDFHDVEGRNTFPSGCHVAVVEVDTATGGVTILKFAAVDDGGVRVNPMIVDGQLHGGIASGIAQALGEEMLYDDHGNPLTSTFAEYQIPGPDQTPFFELADTATASSFNDHGFKGIGESGIVGATPAVHNAIVDALKPFGVRHVELPCTPERIWGAVHGLS